MKEEFKHKYQVINNDVPTIEKVFYIEYLIKGGKCGATKITANSFAAAERIFNMIDNHEKHVLVSIKFIGIMYNGRYFEGTESFV